MKLVEKILVWIVVYGVSIAVAAMLVFLICDSKWNREQEIGHHLTWTQYLLDE